MLGVTTDRSMTGCAYIKQIWGTGLNGEPSKYFEQCNFAYGLRKIHFANPDDLKDTNDIELCETHYHETFDKYTRPEAIAESRYNSEYKKINLIKIELKQSHDWEMLRQYNENPNKYKKLNDLKLEWDYLKFKKCQNDQCANELQGMARKIFSAIVFNKKGGMERKINLCSYNCWNNIRKYIGIIRPPEIKNLPKTLEVYF